MSVERPFRLAPRVFDHQFARFKSLVYGESGEAFVSFEQGLPARWEAYKTIVHATALEHLRPERWKEYQVGSGVILEKAIRAIEIDRRQGARNNLVAWENRYGEERRAHFPFLRARKDRPSREAFESVLFKFFRDQLSPRDAFEAFRTLAGDRYDLIAYVRRQSASMDGTRIRAP
jgi:hypothetical protein